MRLDLDIIEPLDELLSHFAGERFADRPAQPVKLVYAPDVQKVVKHTGANVGSGTIGT
jgi:hypothetical protein